MVQYAPKKYAMKIGVTKEVLLCSDKVMKNGFKSRLIYCILLLAVFLKEEAYDEAVNNESALMRQKENQRHDLEQGRHEKACRVYDGLQIFQSLR